jgi:hypothetical protein
MITAGQDFISEQDFVDVWGARAKASGDLYFFDEVISLPLEHVWTVSEGEDLDEAGFNLDGNWYAVPGIAVINATGYLTTDRPWMEGTPHAVWYWDDDEEARAERRMAFDRR